MTEGRAKPLLVYDGDCGFCRFSVDYWRKLTAEKIDYAPFQEAAQNFPNIPIEQFQQAVQLIEPTGEVSGAAAAVFQTLSYAPGHAWPLWLYQHAPGFAPASEWAYRVVAKHRPFFDRVRLILWGRTLDPSSHFLTRWVFLRLLGIIYLAAFASLWPQIAGLAGTHGILPAHHFFAAITQNVGPERYRLFPTLAWISAGDGFLKFLAGGGTCLSVLLILGIVPGPILLVLWAFYLSLVTAGQDFMSFQWDILLLEAGFLAIFLAPWGAFEGHWKGLRAYLRRVSNPAITSLRSGRDLNAAKDPLAGTSEWAARPPSKIVIWLLRWLLFRLVFLSGCVKLLSHDPTWRNLTAMEYHYETQPLPTPLAWYAFQLPHGFQKYSTAAVFVLEIFVPFLIFTPRRLRFIGCGLLVWFQILIALTGNYAFFNSLAVALCLCLLDDQALRRVLPSALVRRVMPALRRAGDSAGRRLGFAVLAVVILFGSGVLVATTFFGPRSVPQAALGATEWLEPFHIVSSYGLFAVMTTVRSEIIIQGSNDGAHWQDYQFKYKPGNLKKPPGWVAPYQPRLDWQMWFAALSTYRENPWFVNLMIRLLEGSPETLGLFAKNPFPNSPPRYVRAVVYNYRFTNFAERRATNDWWQRQLEGLYFPVATLRKQ